MKSAEIRSFRTANKHTVKYSKRYTVAYSQRYTVTVRAEEILSRLIFDMGLGLVDAYIKSKNLTVFEEGRKTVL